MASTKDAVETFLELGAKYEVVLVGLADDVRRQNEKIDEIERLARATAEHAAQATSEAKEAITSAHRALSQASELFDKTAMVHAEAGRALADFRTELDNVETQLKDAMKRLRRLIILSAGLGAVALIVGGLAVFQ